MRSINPIGYIALAVKEISIQQANSPIPEIPLFLQPGMNLPSKVAKIISNC
jgi:hypothetical protein